MMVTYCLHHVSYWNGQGSRCFWRILFCVVHICGKCHKMVECPSACLSHRLKAAASALWPRSSRRMLVDLTVSDRQTLLLIVVVLMGRLIWLLSADIKLLQSSSDGQIKSWFDLNHDWITCGDLIWKCADLIYNYLIWFATMIWFAIWANHRLNQYEL